MFEGRTGVIPCAVKVTYDDARELLLLEKAC
jgi:hypothetical protein